MAERDSQGRWRKGNKVSRTHGVRAVLAIGKLPKGAWTIRAALGRLRAELEAAVLAVRPSGAGAIDLRDAVTISTAVRQEGRARLLSWHMAKHGDTMTADQILAFTRDICAGTAARDAAILKLLGSSGPAGDAGADLAALLAGGDAFSPRGPLPSSGRDRPADAKPDALPADAAEQLAALPADAGQLAAGQLPEQPADAGQLDAADGDSLDAVARLLARFGSAEGGDDK